MFFLCTSYPSINKIGDSSIKMVGNDGNKTQIPGFDPSSIKGTFANEVHDAQLSLNPEQAAHEYSKSSLRKIQKLSKVETKSSTKTGMQNERRLQALCDAYNFLALAIMLIVLTKSGQQPIDPRLSFNSDRSSSLLNESIMICILTCLGMKEELNELNRNPTATIHDSEEKKRGIAYSTMTSAYGNLSSWTTHIKDRAFNNISCVNTYCLDEGLNFLQTIPSSDERESNEFENNSNKLTFAEQEAGFYMHAL